MKFEENWRRGFRKEVLKWCEQMDGQIDGWQVIIIAHPEPLAQVI